VYELYGLLISIIKLSSVSMAVSVLKIKETSVNAETVRLVGRVREYDDVEMDSINYKSNRCHTCCNHPA
jgi:hypothetical protein